MKMNKNNNSNNNNNNDVKRVHYIANLHRRGYIEEQHQRAAPSGPLKKRSIDIVIGVLFDTHELEASHDVHKASRRQEMGLNGRVSRVYSTVIAIAVAVIVVQGRAEVELLHEIRDV